jgi:hypothetical protein
MSKAYLFALLLDVIEISCKEQIISEDDYHEIVKCIRDYSEQQERELTDEEKSLVRSRFPNPNYNPLVDPSKIRFCYVFCNESSNDKVRRAIDTLRQHNLCVWSNP